MSLIKVKKELYSKKFDEELAKHDQSEFDARVADLNKGGIQATDAWERKKTGLQDYQKKALKKGAWAVLAVIIIVAAIIGIFKYKQSAFSEDRITISISGPQNAGSGELLTYEITCKNNNRAQLKNAALWLRYPETFKPEENSDFKAQGLTSGTFDLGTIGSYGESKVVFQGKGYNPKGNLIYLNAELVYSPSGLSGQLIAKGQQVIKITSSPIVLEVSAPLNTSNSDKVDYLVTYKNIGSKDFNNLKIKMDYPDGFTFSKSDPKNSEGGNIFSIGSLAAGQEGKILISGKLEGGRDEIKVVRAYVGELNQNQFVIHNEEKAETRIIASPLTIAQLVNGADNTNINVGENLIFEINYKNEGEIGLRDVIITTAMDSNVVDFSSLELEKGAYDQVKKEIIWKASDIPNLKFLEPGQGGIINFKIKVKDMITVANNSDKNFMLSSVAKIDSPDVPSIIEGNKVIAGNMINLKLNSQLSLDVNGFYYDSAIKNSGPIPPQANKETTYTIHWAVRNAYNDVSGAKVESMLPTGVVMTGKIFPEDAKLTYNERNNSIIWEIGNMDAGAGIISSPKEVAFQVKINPSVNQVDKQPGILEKSIFSAQDLFTGSVLSLTKEEKTTLLMEDKKLKGFTVVP